MQMQETGEEQMKNQGTKPLAKVTYPPVPAGGVQGPVTGRQSS